MVIANLQPRVSYDFIGSVVRLFLTYNDSAAFSMGFGITWIFTIISSLACLAIIWYGLRVRTMGWATLAGVALGGVSGNLIDRLTRAPGFPSGQVVDFIQVPFNFPIFNLADSAICIVAALVVIAVGRGKKLGG
jgi:signal peptidase II